MAGVGHLNRIWKDVFCVAGAVQETCSSEMSGGQGPYFQHQIFRFARMILRDRCSTSYDLASLFRGRRNTLDRWSGKIAKRIGTRPSALHSTEHLWRKSRRIASFLPLGKSRRIPSCLTLSRSTLRKSCRIAAFLMLSNSKIEEVSQNSFVFNLADRWIDR